MSDLIKLDLGCGQSKREGFIGLDMHPQEGEWECVDVVCNLEERLPFDDNYADEMWSGHFFEHLPKLKVLPVLKECARVLKPGGTLTINVPDLFKVLQNFLDAPMEIKDGWQLDTVFGGQAHEGEFHKTGFWPQKIHLLFQEAGFTSVTVKEVEGWGQPCLEATGVKR